MKSHDSSTTIFIRRRLYHWKTTAAGVAVIVCPILCLIFPAYKETILSVGLALSGGGHLLGADASSVPPSTKVTHQ